MLYIESKLGKVQFDTTIIHVAVNELLNNITGTDVLLQNILKIAARCKMHGISKIFVSSVLNTCKVLSGCEVQFWYKISVRVTVFTLLITITYQWIFV